VLGSYFSACLLVPILLNYLSPNRISDTLFVGSALTSATLMTVWYALPKNEFLQIIDPFYIGILTSLVILLIGSKPPHANLSGVTDW
jgi:hypothetical protein